MFSRTATYILARGKIQTLTFKVCKKCDSLWGKPTKDCFVKSHHLIEFNEDDNMFKKTDTEDDEHDEAGENDDLIYKDANFNDNSVLQKDTKMPPVIFIHLF
jgi:hypothetical protein